MKLIAEVESNRNLGEYYKIRWNGENHFTCDCPQFTFRLRKKKGAKCKHILAALNFFDGMCLHSPNSVTIRSEDYAKSKS